MCGRDPSFKRMQSFSQQERPSIIVLRFPLRNLLLAWGVDTPESCPDGSHKKLCAAGKQSTIASTAPPIVDVQGHPSTNQKTYPHPRSRHDIHQPTARTRKFNRYAHKIRSSFSNRYFRNDGEANQDDRMKWYEKGFQKGFYSVWKKNKFPNGAIEGEPFIEEMGMKVREESLRCRVTQPEGELRSMGGRSSTICSSAAGWPRLVGAFGKASREGGSIPKGAKLRKRCVILCTSATNRHF